MTDTPQEMESLLKRIGELTLDEGFSSHHQHGFEMCRTKIEAMIKSRLAERSVSPQGDDERMKEILEAWGDSATIRYSPAFDVVKRDIDYLLSLLAAHTDDVRVERLRPVPAND